jgi:hypothetical protein
MNLKVIDNFLSDESFYNLKKNIEDYSFDWHWDSFINPNAVSNNFFCFGKMFIEDTYESDSADTFIKPLILQLKQYLNYKSVEIIRAKANMFIKNNEKQKYGFHNDILDRGDNYETLIYYVNDNNGGTEFEDGTFINQKANRGLIVKGKISHQSVGQTDTLRRINLNINYVIPQG